MIVKLFCKIVYLSIMESIVVHPENAEQLRVVTEFLSATGISFEPQKKGFPKHVAEGIERSIQQHRSGQTISLQEFKDKYLSE